MTQISEVFYHIFPVESFFAALVWKSDLRLCYFFLPEKSSINLEERISKINAKTTRAKPGSGIAEIIFQINCYFAGKPYDFKRVKLDFSNCTDFNTLVYKELRKVKHGTTTTYGALAKAVGKPGGARAIGRAVGMNPFPLIIPCHRVISSDRKIGGFSAHEGVGQKIVMLELEGIEIEKGAKPKLKTPTVLAPDSILRGIEFIKKSDQLLGEWIDRLPPLNLAIQNISSPFQALLEAIIYQQLTGKAAATIYGRVLQLFNSNGKIAPLDIIRAKDSELRSAGLSGAKVLALKDLAEKALSGELPELKVLKMMQNEEIIECLTRIRGIGQWTAEMLLIFKLGRADILAADDLGIKKGLAIVRKEKSLPSSAELKKEGELWKPFRTIASLYLWRIADTMNPGK